MPSNYTLQPIVPYNVLLHNRTFIHDATHSKLTPSAPIISAEFLVYACSASIMATPTDHTGNNT